MQFVYCKKQSIWYNNTCKGRYTKNNMKVRMKNMRKITERMAREIYTRGFVLTKKYEYYKNLENGDIYRVPVEMLGKTELLDEDNHKFVCSHAEMSDLAFRGSEKE